MGKEDVTVVILAGGKGTRLRDLFPALPKPLIPVAGRPFLHWLTLWIFEHGPRHFVYSTGYMADQIETWASDGSLPDVERTCRREVDPLGTGGGLLNCLDLCRDWVLVANGDGLVMDGIDEILALRNASVDGGLLGVEVPDTSRYGSLRVADDGRLKGFAEKVPGHGLINGGLYLFRRELLQANFQAGHCSIESDIFPHLIEIGAELKVVAVEDAPFIDIGTPETVGQVEDFVKQHLSLGRALQASSRSLPLHSGRRAG
ncbi:MAG TPA: sugar phosphate nucleotidyltransferase [Sphingomicrobium sp.]|nr:sugar phosphate nucleotidyltransferase [Sphingomicrobium sp.]